jgi:hypothetical protein
MKNIQIDLHTYVHAHTDIQYKTFPIPQFSPHQSFDEKIETKPAREASDL